MNKEKLDFIKSRVEMKIRMTIRRDTHIYSENNIRIDNSDDVLIYFFYGCIVILCKYDNDTYFYIKEASKNRAIESRAETIQYINKEIRDEMNPGIPIGSSISEALEELRGYSKRDSVSKFLFVVFRDIITKNNDFLTNKESISININDITEDYFNFNPSISDMYPNLNIVHNSTYGLIEKNGNEINWGDEIKDKTFTWFSTRGGRGDLRITVADNRSYFTYIK